MCLAGTCWWVLHVCPKDWILWIFFQFAFLKLKSWNIIESLSTQWDNGTAQCTALTWICFGLYFMDTLWTLGVKKQKGGVGLTRYCTIESYLPSVSFGHSFSPETVSPCFIFPLWAEKSAHSFLYWLLFLCQVKPLHVLISLHKCWHSCQVFVFCIL